MWRAVGLSLAAARAANIIEANNTDDLNLGSQVILLAGTSPRNNLVKKMAMRVTPPATKLAATAADNPKAPAANPALDNQDASDRATVSGRSVERMVRLSPLRAQAGPKTALSAPLNISGRLQSDPRFGGRDRRDPRGVRWIESASKERRMRPGSSASPLPRRAPKKQRELVAQLLSVLALDQVPERPGRREPRAVKRRPKPYPLLNKPRH